MNLNTDADEDVTMDSLFTTDTGIANIHTDDNPEQSTNGQKLIIMDNDHLKEPVRPTPDQLFSGPIIKNELPELNAVFINTNNNGINNASDLIEVRNSIVQSNGIGREDIELIDSLAPGFIPPQNKDFYTEEKSKTLFVQTVHTLNTEIDTRVSVISNGIIDFLDKAQEKYIPIVKSLEQNLMDKIVSLQLEVQTLALSIDKDKTNVTDNLSLNDILEFKLDSSEISKDIPENIKTVLVDLDSSMERNVSFRHKLAALFYNQLYSIPGVYFPLGNKSKFVNILDVEPRIIDIDPELEYNSNADLTSESVYYLTTLSTGPGMTKQLTVLLGFISLTVTAFPKYKTIIQDTMNDTKVNTMEKLKFLQTHSSDNARDSLAILNIISFFESFVEYLEKLKAVYTALINKTT